MKTWIVALLVLALPVLGSNVLIFDTSTGRAVAYLLSVHTPSYQGRNDTIINPSLPLGIPLQFLLFTTNGEITVMSAVQSNAVLEAEAAASTNEIRASANAPVTAFTPGGLDLRSLADVAKDEINLLRLEVSVAKTNLSLFQSRPTMAPRTLGQLQNALTNKINNGSVD